MSTSDSPHQLAVRLTFRQHALLALVFLVALGLRGVYLWGQAEHNPMYGHLVMDPAMHQQWASQIVSGEGLGHRPYFRAPLYYYLLAGLYELTGPNQTAGRIAGCIAGALTCYLVAHLGVLLAGFGPGLLAGLLAAFYWPLIYFDAELLTVGLEVLLNVAFLYLLLRAARQDSPLLFLLGGLFWGLSAITRPTVLAFAPAIAVWVWLVASADARPLRRFRAGVLIAVGAVAAILPVTIRNCVVGGEPVLIATNGGVNFYIGNNPKSDGFSAIVPGTRASWEGGYIDTHRIPQAELGRELTEREVSDYWFAKAFAWIRAEPGAWVALTLAKFRLFWSPIEMPNDHPIGFMASFAPIAAIFWLGFPVVACLGIAGLALLWRQWRTWFLPVAFLFVHMVTVIAFFVCGRYRLPIVPVLIVAAAAGLFRVVQLIRTRRHSQLRPYLVAGGLTVGGLWLFSPNLQEFNTWCDAAGNYALGLHFENPGPGQAPDRAQAIAHYRLALRLCPQETRAMCQLAWILATAPEAALRDGTEALSLAQAAEEFVKAGYPPVETIQPRAAAYAELGRYDDAIRLQREALRLARGLYTDIDPEEVAARLRLYEQHQPYRLPS